MDCFFYPILRIVVAVIDDALVIVHGIGDDAANFIFHIVSLFQTKRKFMEGISEDGIEHNLGVSQRLGKNLPYGTQNLFPGKGQTEKYGFGRSHLSKIPEWHLHQHSWFRG